MKSKQCGELGKRRFVHRTQTGQEEQWGEEKKKIIILKLGK